MSVANAATRALARAYPRVLVPPTAPTGVGKRTTPFEPPPFDRPAPGPPSSSARSQASFFPSCAASSLLSPPLPPPNLSSASSSPSPPARVP
eukprot:3444354-Rhodomonas_salina.1